MAKIVEISSDVSVGSPDMKANAGTDNAKKEDAKNMLQQLLEAKLRKNYSLGFSLGMRTMCGTILKKMDSIKKMNAAKQLIVIRQMCNQILDQHNEFIKSQEVNKTTDSASETEKADTDNDSREDNNGAV